MRGYFRPSGEGEWVGRTWANCHAQPLVEEIKDPGLEDGQEPLDAAREHPSVGLLTGPQFPGPLSRGWFHICAKLV